MADCVKIDCCVPSPFDSEEACSSAKYINVRIELPCASGSVGDTVVIEPGQYESLVNQEEADRMATVQAVALRNLTPCKFYNAEQTATVACEDDPLITASSTVPAMSIYSLASIAEANAEALALATTQAQEALVCD